MKFNIEEVQNKIGYTFKNPELLRQCFTHKSFSNEAKGELNNERLEFLGDSILGYVVADYLYSNCNLCDEGDMTELRQQLVSRYPLASAVKKLQIEKYLLKNGSFQKEASVKIYANLYESVLAGIYLDGGLHKASDFIYRTLISVTNLNYTNSGDVNYKGEFKEFVEKNKLGSIEYVLVSKTGKDNAPKFLMQVLLNGKIISTASGNSKRQAEQICAKNALKILKK